MTRQSNPLPLAAAVPAVAAGRRVPSPLECRPRASRQLTPTQAVPLTAGAQTLARIECDALDPSRRADRSATGLTGRRRENAQTTHDRASGPLLTLPGEVGPQRASGTGAAPASERCAGDHAHPRAGSAANAGGSVQMLST